ncbi:MAG: c-type cytochrome, partial [Elusimicrobia bacterium]|nr:c-type cytochrome [Elusimicrobiota bacterium]
KKCAQCHGTNGTPFIPDPNTPGDYLKNPDDSLKTDNKLAPAAAVVFPRPRDFTKGAFKFRTTPSGEVPRDEDLIHIIKEGMPGSSMPAWKDALTDSQIKEVVAYIKSFSERFQSEQPSAPLKIGKPPKATEDSLKKGREIFVELGCVQCHGIEGRADGPSAPGLKDDWGNPIHPANFHKGWNFRAGYTVQDIYRTIMTGFNGTPMPSYADAFGEDKEKPWHLANYIHSLSADQPNTQEVLEARHMEKLPGSPADRSWETIPSIDFLLSGQIVQEPRLFTPPVDMLSARAAYNSEEIALLLEWDDPTRDIAPSPDVAQVQIPIQTKEGEKPYFLEGDPQNPGNLWRWDAKTDRVQNLKATGLNLPKLPLEKTIFFSSSTYSDGHWQLLIKRKRVVEPAAGLRLDSAKFIPIAFAVNNSISTWYYIFLKPPASKAPYVYAFTTLILVAWLEKRWIQRGK